MESDNRFFKVLDDEIIEPSDKPMTLMDIADRSVMPELGERLFGESPMLSATEVIQATNEICKGLNEAGEKFRQEAWEPVWDRIVAEMQGDGWVRIA